MTTATAKKVRRAKTTPLIELLRRTTCSRLHGKKTPVGVRPSECKDSFLAKINSPFPKRRPRRLANYNYEEHFSGQETYYFFGNPSFTAESTLAMVDIDCHKRGTLAGALQFANYLKSLWPGLVFETSTNGNGVHAYVCVSKYLRHAEDVNEALRSLDKFLKKQAMLQGADIENVEVKGQAPVFTYAKPDKTLLEGFGFEGSDRRIVVGVRYGFLAKLPRTISYESLRHTTCFTLEQLHHYGDTVTAEDEEAIKRWLHPEETVAKTKVKIGSSTGHLVPDERPAAFSRYVRCAKTLMCARSIPTERGYVATAEDMAILLLVLQTCYEHPNPDGTLPTRRIEGLWTALYECGAVPRPWNHHRYKVLRDFLSEHGHLDWTDHTYSWGEPLDRGQDRSKGRACKWALTKEMFELLSRITEEEASFMGSAFPDGPGEWKTPTPRLRLVGDGWLRNAENRIEVMFGYAQSA